jgi:hypothetical protein
LRIGFTVHIDHFSAVLGFLHAGTGHDKCTVCGAGWGLLRYDKVYLLLSVGVFALHLGGGCPVGRCLVPRGLPGPLSLLDAMSVSLGAMALLQRTLALLSDPQSGGAPWSRLSLSSEDPCPVLRRNRDLARRPICVVIRWGGLNREV